MAALKAEIERLNAENARFRSGELKDKKDKDDKDDHSNADAADRSDKDGDTDRSDKGGDGASEKDSSAADKSKGKMPESENIFTNQDYDNIPEDVDDDDAFDSAYFEAEEEGRFEESFLFNEDHSVGPEHMEKVRMFKAQHEASKAKLQELQKLVDEKRTTDELVKLEKQKIWDAKFKEKREDISRKVGESWDIASSDEDLNSDIPLDSEDSDTEMMQLAALMVKSFKKMAYKNFNKGKKFTRKDRNSDIKGFKKNEGKEEKSGKVDKSKFTCFNCGEKGHFATECKKAKNENGQAFITKKGN
ncbi:uncharacterized protein LOC135150465 [Daucus carota subsp. sativus]|uniref:uncharacterized protein LOC135150465 n=1 Tax=Daucus carota subsp. sativus TaxID=79200 RepID=UPI003083C18E